MPRRLLPLIAAIALLALAVPSAASAAPTPATSPELSYTSLREAIKQRKVKSADLYPVQGVAKLTLRDGSHASAGYPISDQDLAGQLADAGAQVEVFNKPTGPSPLTVLPLVLILAAVIGLGIFMAARKQNATSVDRVGGTARKGKGTRGPRSRSRTCASATWPGSMRSSTRCRTCSCSSPSRSGSRGSAPSSRAA
jgi:ATP-dependent Zn protease